MQRNGLKRVGKSKNQQPLTERLTPGIGSVCSEKCGCKSLHE